MFLVVFRISLNYFFQFFVIDTQINNEDMRYKIINLFISSENPVSYLSIYVFCLLICEQHLIMIIHLIFGRV